MKKGRRYVILCKDGQKKFWLVHRLVLIAFEGYSDNPLQNQVNHIDGNPLNNTLINLEWCTQSENMKHKFDVLGQSNCDKGKKYHTNGARKVDQYSLDGEFITTYVSATEAQDKGGFNADCISGCLNGYQKTHKGYIFKYNDPKWIDRK